MKKTNLTLKKKDFLYYYLRKFTRDGACITIGAFFLFAIASIIHNPSAYFFLLLFCFFVSLYIIKIMRTIKANSNQLFSLSITKHEYEILRPNEKGKLVSTFFESFRNFHSYDTFKNYIFLYVSKRMVFILNSDMFTHDEWEELNASIKSQVRKKKINHFIIFLHVMVSSMLIVTMISGLING